MPFENKTTKEEIKYLLFVTLQTAVLFIARSEAESGYLNNIPYGPISGRDDYPNYPVHDADVKIPGRHSPKRPYLHQNEQLYYDVPPEYQPNDGPQLDRVDPPPTLGPHFDRNVTRNTVVEAGKTATLTCRVKDISKMSVSWIRLRDLHILTVDKYKYNTDRRITIDLNATQKEWELKIRNVRLSDAGRYECQVSTRPVLSFIVNLEVVVSKAYIVNSPDIYVHRGSLINLTCIVNNWINQPIYIYWFHRSKLLDVDDGRRKLEMFSRSKGQTVSQLLVGGARLSDSGKYACKPSNGDPGLALLHVLRGEQQAAMQTNGVVGKSITLSVFFILLITFRHSLRH